ncbi:MAG: Rieske 2Fe-2S domain-containing protein [Acidobacteriota bacterium]|nr:Rieske 2Fe-2S domain-containing protein [Acidobacteriota bacterium]
MSALVAFYFLLAAVAGSGFGVSYWLNGDIVIEGSCLGASLLLVAAGLVVWSHHLLPNGPYFESYPEMQSPPDAEAEVLATVDRGGVGRRRLLLGSLGAVGVTVGGGLVSTVRSFGPAPNSLASTVWKERLVLVDSDGKPMKVGDLPVGGELSVYPQGFPELPQVPAMLIHLPPGANHPLPGRGSWTPHNLICYSKVCSHAGCPVNLYDRMTLVMECPCHQSVFDVTRGAQPIFGPAGGPLSQLPLSVDPDGTLRSAGDFDHPPGPVFWHYSGSHPA